MRPPSSRPRQPLALSPRARRAISPRTLRLAAGPCPRRTSHAVAGPSSSPRRGIFLPRSLRLAALERRRRSEQRQICEQEVFVPHNLDVVSSSSSLSLHEASTPDVPTQSQACWSSIPEEILHYICSMVTTTTIARMKMCCRHWCHNTVSILSADNPIWFCFQNDKMLFYLAKDGYKFSMQHNFDLPPNVLYYSSLGFLVTIVGQKYSILVLNLATCTQTYTPRLANHLIEQVISWETQDAQVQTISLSSHAGTGYFSVSVLRKMTNWITTTYKCTPGFHLSMAAAPVILKNSVYALGMDCEIAIFDIDNQMMTFIPIKSCCNIGRHQVCRPVVVNNDIIAVVTDVQCNEPPVILKLNMEHQVWEMMKSLGGISLYSGSPSSYAVEDSCMQDSVTVAALSNDSLAVEVKVRCENGTLFFIVDNCVPVQPSSDFSTWLLDQEGVPLTKGNADRQKSGDGTWIRLKSFIRPKISSKHGYKEIDDYTDSDSQSDSDSDSSSHSDTDSDTGSKSDGDSDSDSDSDGDSEASIGPLENPKKNRSNDMRHGDCDSDNDTDSDADCKSKKIHRTGGKPQQEQGKQHQQQQPKLWASSLATPSFEAATAVAAA